ncbi:MAG TPA: DUF2218 domain-containing protein [Actinophytocola sp.]|uniref:DUF2218 domain-containing protein n=1 Tax=Actinophytocola sp. TaxID=1872138 RepID=UPI002E056258|nr:DUF2218 domain-containing protein [Actinophytocola sp.]
MPTAEAEVRTDRPSRYLVQLCRHASQMGRHRITRVPAHLSGDPEARHDIPAHIDAEWSDTQGVVSVDGGRCTLRATPDTLILRAEADTEEKLQRMQDLITRNLTRFSRRDPLTVNWHRESTAGGAADPTTAPVRKLTTRHGHRRTIVLLAAGVLAIAAHVVLGGAVLAAPSWTSLAADVVLVIVVVKVAVIGIGYLAHRHSKTARTR